MCDQVVLRFSAFSFALFLLMVCLAQLQYIGICFVFSCFILLSFVVISWKSILSYEKQKGMSLDGRGGREELE